MLPPFIALAILTGGFWANPNQQAVPPAQIGVPKFVQVGKLSCAGRLVAAGLFQSWCYKGAKLVSNAVTDFSDLSMISDQFTDSKPGEVFAQIGWLVATVENAPGAVSYQITITVGSNPATVLSGNF